MGCSLPGSSVHRIFQARILEWFVISFSRGSSWCRDRTQVSWTAGRLYHLSHQGNPSKCYKLFLNLNLALCLQIYFFLIFLIKKKKTPISEQKEYQKIMFHGKCHVIKILLFFCCKLFQLFETPWTAAHQVSLPFTISQSLLKLTSIELVMPSNNLILHFPLLLLLSIFPSIRVFPNESALLIRWKKH